VYGLVEHHNTPLNEPAKDDLCHRSVMFTGDRNQDLVMEQVILALCKRSLCFNLDAIFLHNLGALDLLIERIGLYLVNGRYNFIVKDQIH